MTTATRSTFPVDDAGELLVDVDKLIDALFLRRKS
jgi:hypothetical protein